MGYCSQSFYCSKYEPKSPFSKVSRPFSRSHQVAQNWVKLTKGMRHYSFVNSCVTMNTSFKSLMSVFQIHQVYLRAKNILQTYKECG